MKQRKQFIRLAAAALLGVSLAGAPKALAQTDEKPYTFVEQMPQFKGGESQMLKFLGSNIKYPGEAKSNAVEGLVVVQFVVEKDGSISEVQPVKKLGYGTDEEAVRVIKLMNGQWTAGRQNGKPVRVRYVLPIRFSINDTEKSGSEDKANNIPQYKGGQEAMLKTMSTYLKLPDDAIKENLNAKVIVRFDVDKEGKVSNIRLDGTKLKKTVGPDSDLDYMDASTFGIQNRTLLAKLSEAAVAAVKATSGNWEPALKNGKPAISEVVLPVQFLGTADKNSGDVLSTPSMSKYIKESYDYDEVDVKPMLQDGPLNRFLAKNMRYPKDLAYEGDYKSGFVIKSDGSVIGPFTQSNRAIDKEDQYLIDEEIRRVLKLMDGKWNPGKVDGQAVKVSYNFTIRFITNNGSKKSEASSEIKPDVIITRHK